MHSVYDAAGGDTGLLRLAQAWHGRVMVDETVSHAFLHGFHPQHTERLAANWGEAWGGPTTYSQRYGSESSVVRMHSGNGLHEEMDHRAVECFDRALDDVKVADPELRGALLEYVAWATKSSMAAYPESAEKVPSDLSIPHWSWEGLQR